MDLMLFLKLVGDRGCQWPYFNFVLKLCWSVGFGCCLNLTWRLKVNTSLKHMVHELKSFCHQPLLFFPTLGSRTPESSLLSPFLSWDPGEIFLLTWTPAWQHLHFFQSTFPWGKVCFFLLFFFPLPRNFFSKNEQISLVTLQRPVAFPTVESTLSEFKFPYRRLLSKNMCFKWT